LVTAIVTWGLLCASTSAIINPNFTPADLVKGHGQVFLLEVSAPDDNVVSARILEALRGKAPDQKRLALHLDGDRALKREAVDAAFGGKKTATAVLAIAEDRQGKAKDTPVGAIQINTMWFAVHRSNGKLVLDEDKQDLFPVWAGSARMLAAAARYVASDPLAYFPVRCDLTWVGDQRLGQLSGTATGCLAVDLGQPSGPCALVLSSKGDRLYRWSPKADEAVEVKGKFAPPTTSKMVAVGDYNGDGLLDLASWNGKSLCLALRAADGSFAPPKQVALLDECLSLHCIGVEGGAAALVAGRKLGPVLLAPDGKGGFTCRPVADGAGREAGATLGPGGFCVMADFNRDGRCDVLQLHAKGALLYAGQAPGRFGRPGRIEAALVGDPRTAVCGDFDTDGLLDVAVGGEGGMALLCRREGGRWANETYVTGELAYHGNQNAPRVVAAAGSDVNSDGRQGVALFYAARKPMLFFNRGFACFGWARELDLAGADQAMADPGAFDPLAPPPEKLKGLEALQHGQAAGALLDLNGDGLQDQLAVAAKTHEVWALFGGREDGQPIRSLVLTLHPRQTGPLTVTVRDGGRCRGMYVVRPGAPTMVGRPKAGPVTLQWIGPDGKARARTVVVVRGCKAVELAP